MLVACARTGQEDLMAKLLRDMGSRGIKKDVLTYNSLMSRYAKEPGGYKKSLETFQEMKEKVS